MDREIKTALGASAGIAGLFIGFILLVRYAVPAILSARFSGNLLVAAVVGIAGILLLVWAGARLWSWTVKTLRR